MEYIGQKVKNLLEYVQKKEEVEITIALTTSIAVKKT